MKHSTRTCLPTTTALPAGSELQAEKCRLSIEPYPIWGRPQPESPPHPHPQIPKFRIFLRLATQLCSEQNPPLIYNLHATSHNPLTPQPFHRCCSSPTLSGDPLTTPAWPKLPPPTPRRSTCTGPSTSSCSTPAPPTSPCPSTCPSATPTTPRSCRHACLCAISCCLWVWSVSVRLSSNPC